ncbi:MAG TPA: chromate efflux transporter [Thermoanaerobaculia bacterium]|nr:chromate efflux transporter [Thermoanaerobaculia bacterium]
MLGLLLASPLRDGASRPPRVLETNASDRNAASSGALGELARLFLKLGTTAFGGPAAHIAMMEEEVVRRRRWLSRERFLDLLGATNLIPGPNSTEMAIHVGYLRGGWPGLLVAGSCFILPAAVIVTAIAWAYVRFGTLPQVEGLLWGAKPVVIAVVVQAIASLGRSIVRSRWLLVVALVALVASLAGANELVVLAAAGVLVAAARAAKRGGANALALLAAAGPAVPIVPLTLTGIFLFFLKVGSVLFGSGYVLVAFLRADLVSRWHWLTESQLLDAVAVGQVTPGPVFTTATFIGYVLAGWKGAGLATAGIFLPAFVLVAASGPLVPRLRRSRIAGGFLDGVNAGSLALMAAVTLQLARPVLVDPVSITIAAIAAVLLIRFRISSAWLLPAAALLRLLLRG